MSTISVVIPTYNRAHTLQRAVDSVLAQTLSPQEVIVVDDGSQDNTEQLIKSRYPQVRYLKQANQGVSAARNLGIAEANGEWIALLDSDDEWLPEKLQTQVELLTTAPNPKLIHSDEIWIRNGKRVNQMKKHTKTGGWIFQHCLPLCAISPSAAMIHQDIFQELGHFDETLPACEDYDLWLRVTCRYPVLYCETPLIVKYGGHEDQLSQQYWGMDRFRVQALVNILNSAHLTAEDYDAARKMLVTKLNVLLKGARKRENTQLIEECETQLQRWSTQVS